MVHFTARRRHQVTLHRSVKPSPHQLLGLALLSPCLFALGCVAATAPPDSPVPAPQIQGHIHGGQQPVTGASIQLYAAGTTGYGTGAVPLLSSPILSDANGNFTITNAAPCPSTISQLYIVATGGNPGLSTPTNNTSLALAAAIGPCVLNGSQYTISPTGFINIDEVTTVASVYALAGFMNPSTSQIGSSSTNIIGIANAFQSVANLVNIANGQSLGATPAGNATVPQAEINTLADILAPCVNSSGSGAACTSLFSAATPSGGTAPVNTLQAMYNIAVSPASQVSALFALSTATAPFQPTLSAAPNDWTIALHYSGGGLTGPDAISIDSIGDVWLANDPSFVIELSSSGAFLSGSTGFTGGGIHGPRGLAIDLSDNVWVANFFGNSVTKLSNSGAILSGPNGFTNGISGTNGPTFVAIDGTGNAWVTNQTFPGFTITKLAGDGSLLASGLSPCTTASTCQLQGPTQIAIDAAENVWVVNNNPGPGAVAKLNNSGTVLSGETGFTNGLANASFLAFDHSGNGWATNYTSDGGSNNLVTKIDSNGNLLGSVNPSHLFQPSGIAIDGSGNAWAIGSASPVLVELNNSQAVLSGANGYVDAAPLNVIPGCTVPPAHTCVVPRYSRVLAIDGSGNVWVTNTDSSVSEFVGAATPVVTPLSLGIKNNTLGTRP